MIASRIFRSVQLIQRTLVVTPRILADLKFSEDHEWVRVEGNIATIGITDHAQDQMGDITFIDEAEVGEEVEKGENITQIDSTKSSADVIAPISLKITEFNAILEEEPELLNKSPTDEGWIVKGEIIDESELDDLMTEEAYQEFCRNEA